jgi:DNA-binding PadR family transcriptional regulator
MNSYERDLTIFKLMADGPITAQWLYQNSHEFFASLDAVYQRLRRLTQSEFINTRRYYSQKNNRTFSLYALSEAGCQVLMARTTVTTDQIRMNLPASHTVDHELAVSSVLRTLKKESSWLECELQFIHEDALRQSTTTARKKQNFPDLFVSIRNAENLAVIQFEVDMGSIPPRQILAKTKEFKELTIFLCQSKTRIAQLQRMFEEQSAKFNRTVFFADLEQFCRENSGISGTDLISIGNIRGRIQWLADLRRAKFS